MQGKKLFALGIAVCVSNGFCAGVKLSIGGTVSNPVVSTAAEFGDRSKDWGKVKDANADSLETMMLLHILRNSSWDVAGTADAMVEKWKGKADETALKAAAAAVENANKVLPNSFTGFKLKTCLKDAQKKLRGDKDRGLIEQRFQNVISADCSIEVDKILAGSKNDAESYVKDILAKYGLTDTNGQADRDAIVNTISRARDAHDNDVITRQLGDLLRPGRSSFKTLYDTHKAKLLACLDKVTGDSINADEALKLWAEAALGIKDAEKVEMAGFFDGTAAKTKRYFLYHWKKMQDMSAWQKFGCATLAFLALSTLAKNYAPESISSHLTKVLEFGTGWFCDLGKEGSLLGTASEFASWPIGKVAGMFRRS